MPGQYILAHDLGTTGNKASLYDRDGRMVASSFFGYGLELPHVNWVEQNPEDWWQAVCASTRQLLAAAKVQPGEIACITFSGQMMGCVVVDRRARPLRNALIWADMRAVAEAQTIIDGVGMAEAYRITGHRASSSYSGAKILWVRNHQPEIFAQAHKFLHAKDFIVARLTGNFVTDYSDASGMNLYDLQAGDWSDVILDAIGLDRAVLPELHASTDVVGAVMADGGRGGRPGGRHAGGDRRRRRLLRGDGRGRRARGQRLQLHRLVVVDRARHEGAHPGSDHAHLHLGAPGAGDVQPVRDDAGGGRLVPMAAG